MKHLFTKLQLSLAALLFSISTTAQTSATIDPRNYSLVNPYIFPDYPDRTTVYLIIKTGKPTYITFPGVVAGYQLVRNPDGTSLDPTQNNFELARPGLWNFEYYYNGTTVKAISLVVSYQADLQDQTIGSATYGDYPDFIWVPQGGSAVVSAGKYMNPTGGTYGYYRWRNMDESIISKGYIDSVKTVTFGSYICQTTDESATSFTRDTISILEKPTLNTTTKTLSFPSTVAGISYQLIKCGSVVGTDTTWTTAETYTGDGAAKDFVLPDAIYKLTVSRGIHTSTYPYSYFRTGITTGLHSAVSAVAYRQVGEKLLFNRSVWLRYYNLEGSLILQGESSEFKVPAGSVGLFVAVDKFGNILKGKVGF